MFCNDEIIKYLPFQCFRKMFDHLNCDVRFPSSSWQIYNGVLFDANLDDCLLVRAFLERFNLNIEVINESKCTSKILYFMLYLDALERS